MTATPDSNERPDYRGLIFVAAFAAVMWLVEIVDVFAGDLDSAGIRPRQVDGLTGIAFAPVLHGGFGHLAGNTVPFLVLGAAIAVSGLMRILSVTAIVIVVGGLGTWLTAPANTVVIGASGVVFGYASYLVARGVFTRRMLHIVMGVAVILDLRRHADVRSRAAPRGVVAGPLLRGGVARAARPRRRPPDRPRSSSERIAFGSAASTRPCRRSPPNTAAPRGELDDQGRVELGHAADHATPVTKPSGTADRALATSGACRRARAELPRPGSPSTRAARGEPGRRSARGR